MSGMGHTFNGYMKEEWVYDMGCELSNLLAGEYPNDGETLPHGIRVLLTEFEGLVTRGLRTEREDEERLTAIPDEIIQRWASLMGTPCRKEDVKTVA